MNKEEFLKELEQHLVARQVEEPQAYLDYFEEILDDMKEEGLGEEEAAGRLGNPEEIAQALAAELGQQGKESDASEEESPKTHFHADFSGFEKLDKLDKLNNLQSLSGLSSLSGLGRMINGIVKNAVKSSGAGSWSSKGQSFTDYDITFPLQGINSLEVIWLDGDVELKAAERADILLCESRLAGAEPLYTELRGDTLVVAYTKALCATEEKAGLHSGWQKARGKDLEIELPSSLAGQLESLKLKTASGDLELKDIKARSLFLETASGDMEGSNLTAEDMHIKCVSGDAELALKARHLYAKSVSGDLELNILESPESLTAESISGDIEVRLPAGSQCNLRHQSVSGDVHVGGMIMNVPGAPEYSIKTVSGDVEIRTF